MASRRAKSRAAASSATRVSRTRPGDPAAAGDQAERIAWMDRLACVGQVARLICEQLTADQEAQVQRAAQLVIVGRIVESLIRDDGELSTAELARLVQVFVSQRKLADTAAGASEKRKRDRAVDKLRPLPEGFREAIQQIYGVSLASGENRLPGKSEAETSGTNG